MRKIINFLLVRRPETKDKWWHRLALVLIYGSTIVVAIFLAVLLISEEGDYWVSESYTAYSFEQEYATAKGKEVDCKFSATSLGDLPPVSIFNCGNISSDTEFLEKYARARGTYEKLEENREQINSTLASGGLLGRIQRANATDDKIMVQLIQNGELDNIKVKRAVSVDYASFFGNWGVYLLLVLVWFVFWESIAYRTILFVAYGRK